jgi:16S rRNA (uracil1498-N3)-methyltransferase
VHRFYAPDFAADREISLPEAEARHLARVLRLSVGDSISVFDGKGREVLARVESIQSRRVKVKIIEERSPSPESTVAITLAQALLKSDKMDRVIRDAVMLGVTAIQPFVSGRTDIPRAALKTAARRERWDRTVISSVKQCGRAVVPPVLETKEFDTIVSSPQRALMLMCVEPGAGVKPALRSFTSLEGEKPSEAIVLIGPEGGWDPREIDQAAAAGILLVTFGSRVLRADAAGAAMLAVLRYIWRDL